jgi:hypothetical protein
MANPTAYELMMANSAKEEEPTEKTPSFADDFGKSFLDIYKHTNKPWLEGGSSSSNSKASPFQVSDMGGSTITPIGESGKHQLHQFIGSKPIIQVAGAPGAPGIGGAGAAAAVKWAAPKLLAMLGCDERLKVDMAPLESTEVNDALAEVAFFVKGLRECA